MVRGRYHYDARGNYQLIPQGAIAVTGDKIVWIGPHAELPPIHAARQVVYEGGLITLD